MKYTNRCGLRFRCRGVVQWVMVQWCRAGWWGSWAQYTNHALLTSVMLRPRARQCVCVCVGGGLFEQLWEQIIRSFTGNTKCSDYTNIVIQILYQAVWRTVVRFTVMVQGRLWRSMLDYIKARKHPLMFKVMMLNRFTYWIPLFILPYV